MSSVASLRSLHTGSTQTRTRFVTFAIPGQIELGVNAVPFQCPFTGKLLGVSASCFIPDTEDVVMRVEKTTKEEFHSGTQWVDITDDSLVIPGGNKVSDTIQLPSVKISEGDYLRLVVTHCGVIMEDLMVGIKILI